jgi:FAD/FMN-containing dehydrogenase
VLTRRQFLTGSAALAWWSAGCDRRLPESGPTLVNDIHSQLNLTRVYRVARPDSLKTLQAVVQNARAEGRPVSIAGGRHAAGGQQFGSDTVLIDMGAVNRVLHFDPARGDIHVEAGTQWPELMDSLVGLQTGRRPQWGIVQKQGVDGMSIGGALAANVHGSGLSLPPFVGDVESFVLVDAEGVSRTCDRGTNADLFRLVIGGYGLFGIIVSVRLRLAPRRKLERVVEIIEVEDLVSAVEKRIAEGFLYGNFQYATDESSDDFLRKGIFSCHRPADESKLVRDRQPEPSEGRWRELLYLAHTDKKRAFEVYAADSLSTSGQIYWSDTHQLAVYVKNYHAWLDQKLGTADKATEVLVEFFVPRKRLVRFLEDVRKDFRENKVNLIFGSIRFVERDDETFLAWARDRYACVVFNIHTVHAPPELERAAQTVRRLVDLTIRSGGTYYLTYHPWATRKQVEACYPQFPEFLRQKLRYDPEERFQSDWYRYYKAVFADAPG